MSITVPHQDTVCCSGKQQGCQLHTRCSMVHNSWGLSRRRILYVVEAGLFSAHVLNQRQSPRLYTGDDMTHMVEFRSQISSRSSVMAAKTVDQFGDHRTAYTSFWLDMRLNTGVKLSCFQSWTVQSEEQLRNTSELNGDHSMKLTGH